RVNARGSENGRSCQPFYANWPDFKTLNPNIWYTLYADDYSTMTIICYGKEEMLLTLRGDDPHLSPH
ncbi:4251_t:CDS:2, partial [Funneliformis caledonium]